MGQEIEIKLTINAAHLDRILGHPLVVQHAKGTLIQLQLLNTYYDTPAFDLHHHRMALRVRSQGGQFVQTLKTSGDSLDGLSSRGEWEWPLPDECLQPALVPNELWPPRIGPSLDLITPVFSTSINRTVSRVTLPENLLGPGQAEACIELALDRGMVSTKAPKTPRSEAISEIEMELIYGELATLRAFSQAATAGLPVSPCDISKAERGYRLLDL